MIDPREVVKCACPRIAGADCIRARSAPPWSEPDDDRWTEEGEECECACHDIHKADLAEDDQ